jgi:hypothetical protein
VREITLIITSPERSKQSTGKRERSNRRHHCSRTELFPCKWAGGHDSSNKEGGSHVTTSLHDRP